jgi:gliding motility-associated-like protein
MKHLVKIAFMMLCPMALIAQTNLVPNGDFEEKTACPGSTTSFFKLKNWLPCGTPDYFHVCALSESLQVPENYVGYQYPQSGSAYVGLITYAYYPADFREYIKVKLNTKLVKDCNYLIILYYSNAEKVKYISNEFGILFTTSDIECYYAKYELIQQEASLQNYNLDDTSTIHWMKYTGIYQAKGDEEWLIIGNFKNDAQSVTFIQDNSYKEYAYLYIDNVQLYNLCEDTTAIDLKNIKPAIPGGISNNNDGKNDHLKLLNAALFNSFKIKLYDRWGNLLYSSNDANFEWDGTYQGSKVPMGVYVWQAVYTTIYDNTEQYSTGTVTVLY